MIASWRDAWLRNWFEHNIYSKQIPADLRDRLFRKLQLLDDSAIEADLRVPPSNHFERLSGKLEGWCSIRVNDHWRLVFRWNDGEANDLYLELVSVKRGLYDNDQEKACERGRDADI